MCVVTVKVKHRGSDLFHSTFALSLLFHRPCIPCVQFILLQHKTDQAYYNSVLCEIIILQHPIHILTLSLSSSLPNFVLAKKTPVRSVFSIVFFINLFLQILPISLHKITCLSQASQIYYHLYTDIIIPCMGRRRYQLKKSKA